MSHYIRLSDNKKFTYHHEIRLAYPDINFPSIITDDMLNEIGIQQIVENTVSEDPPIITENEITPDSD